MEEKLIPGNTLDKINSFINGRAERRSMTRDEFDSWAIRETDRLEISDYEYNLILAYQTDKSTTRLFASAHSSEAEKEEREKYWINYFRNDFPKVDKAVKHLTEVCALIEKRYDVKYYYEWLLDWDSTLYHLILEKKDHKKKRKPQKDY